MRCFRSIVVTIFTLVLISTCFAQVSPTASVPNLIRYEGTLHDSSGAPLCSATTGLTFAIYKQQEGGGAVWLETQSVTTDAHGNYTAVLGNTTATGLPGDLFSPQEQRWLGVQMQGEEEQPRVLLVSVPYALKAQDAETLGGMPASAFVLAPQSEASNQPSGGHSAGVQGRPGLGHGTPGYIPVWQNPVMQGNSILFQSGGNVGVGTTAPGATLEVNGTTKFDQAVAFAGGQTFPGTATLGSNTFTGNQTINGNLSVTGAMNGGEIGSGTAASAAVLTANGSGGSSWLATGPNAQVEFWTSSAFTVPAGVSRIRAFVYAAGGGAGASLNNNQLGANGGSGAFGEGVISVTPGEQLTITIGAGGAGGAPGTTQTGGSGGATEILDQNMNVLLSAGGGGGGMCGACPPYTVGSGGAAGVGPAGSLLHSGPDGNGCGGGQTRCAYPLTFYTSDVDIAGRGFNNGNYSETETIDGISGYVYLEW